MIVLSYGGGTNSAAILVGMVEKKLPAPDLIMFADTGGEKPHTYRHIELVNIWLSERGWPAITIVKRVDKYGEVLTLEKNCLDKKVLPSIAYGFKTCSQKFKIAPQDKYLNNHSGARAEWAAGRKVTKLVGYDAGESHRARNYDNDKYNVQYPLIDWGWGRDECVAAIARAGLPQPGKSACFYCPNSRPSEIREMAAQYPELADRALEMERNAELTQIKGLGRGSFAWGTLLATDDMFPFPDRDMPCGCGL